MKKYFLITLICMIAGNAAYLSAGAAVPSFSPVFFKRHANQDNRELLNKPAPAFELPGIDGKLYSLKDLKGNIVVLNFWFIACKPCVNEIPILNSIKRNYDPKKVVFLALPLDNKDAVSVFLQQHHFNYVMLPGAAPVHQIPFKCLPGIHRD